MKDFVYNKIPTVYFGEGVLKKNLPKELEKVGTNVMLAYGGGSVKRTGLYDEIMSILKQAQKNVTEFSGIMSNPTYSKVQEGIKLAKEAVAGLSSARKGYCAQAVKNAISDAGLGAYESGDAYEVPNILRRNNNFKEVKVKGSDLAKLPAGCVIAYAKGAAGYSSKYGHVEIKGEGNQAISFFVNNNIKPSDDVSVFVPV